MEILEERMLSKCPEGHLIPWKRENFAYDGSDELRDSDGLPMREVGLYCHGCDRSYGLSRLITPS